MIDISVVIPVFNAETTIDICFHSVYNDLIKSGYTYEIILINDGSTDNSLQKINKIKMEYDPCVVVVHQKNAGPSSARNAGLRIARGQYISFCDSDDMWIQGKTSLSMKILKMYPDIRCLGGKYTGGKITDTIELKDIQDITINKKIKYISLKMNLFKNRFSPQTVILSREVVMSGIFFNEKMKYSEDMEYFNRIMTNFPVAVVKEVFTRTVVGKNVYGDSGLSSRLWDMEKGELYGIYLAYKSLGVNGFICVIASAFSILKYFKRLFVVAARRIF